MTVSSIDELTTPRTSDEITTAQLAALAAAALANRDT